VQRGDDKCPDHVTWHLSLIVVANLTAHSLALG